MKRIIIEDVETHEGRVWLVEPKVANEISGLLSGLYGEAKSGEVITSVD